MLERKKTRIVQFLMKLRLDFKPIRAKILNRETLPNIDVVFGELIHEEILINTLETMDSSYIVDAAKNLKTEKVIAKGRKVRRLFKLYMSSKRKASSPDRYGYSPGRYDRSYDLLATLNSIFVPTTYQWASSHGYWKREMEEELLALEENHT
ncbi:hypothetical protein HAX54_000567 [Datura stramonium]|uniref:Uncharacterized protein n=1 Tax=Datura stramonium TaxID=4076 RepID=A0ABS8T280_DATST|nr:hypothetical protein [Datura stramonium]